MAEQVQHQLPEKWGQKAEDYEALFVPLSRPAAKAAVEAVELATGERFLDIAAGTGEVTIEAARAGARVVATDFSEGMLTVLRGKLAREGIEGIEVLRMDGQNLEFEDETFDVAGSGFGVVWFPDRDLGLREMRRVLKPGGRAFITSTGHPGSSQLQQLIGQAMMTAGSGGRRPVPRGLPNADEIARMMESGGFRDVHVATVKLGWPVPEPQAFWEKWVLESPVSDQSWRETPASLQAAASREFVRLVEASGTTEFATEVLIGLGRT